MQNPLTATNTSIYNPVKGVYCYRIVFVNVIFIAINGTEDNDKPEWVLIDAGLKGFSGRIKRLAAKHFGEGNPPKAIILTHGHFDHVGSLKKLAEEWDVPVYCHRLEFPYVTGKSAYPPQDPTVDYGLMAMVSRIYPTEPIDLGNRVFPLPADGIVPFLDEWTWYHVPGHSPGQVALFRENDRALISADAFVTTKQESAYAVMTQRKEINGPPAYFTIDWETAEDSVRLLEGLRPDVVVSGHGRPMQGSKMRKELRELAHHFRELAMPEHGRYVNQPAIADERGVVDVPPPVTDVLPRVLAGVGLLAVAATTSYLLLSRNSGSNGKNVRAESAKRSKSTGATAQAKQTDNSSAGNKITAKTSSKKKAEKQGAKESTAISRKAAAEKNSKTAKSKTKKAKKEN